MGRMFTTLSIVVFAWCGVTSAASAKNFGEVLGNERVRTIIGEETENFQRESGLVLGLSIEVAPDFLPFVVEEAQSVEVPHCPEMVEQSLRDRFGKFLANLTSFLVADEAKPSQMGELTTSGTPLHAMFQDSARRRIRFSLTTVQQYLAAAFKAGRCGEVPCKRGCNPCDNKCNKC